MQDNIQEAVSLTHWLRFSAPTKKRSLMYFLILGILVGGLTELVFDFTPKGFLVGGSSGLILLSLPALISAALCSRKKEMQLKSALYLALITTIVYSLFFVAAKFINWNLLLLGNGIVFAIEMWVAIVFFRLKQSSVVLASLHPALNILFAIADQSIQLLTITTPELVLYKVIFSAFVFITVIYILIMIASAPIRKNFGVSGLQVLIYFISQWFYRRSDLEDLFDEIGEEQETYIGALTFEGKEKHAIFVPCVHFGPFGELGGSDLPARISNAIPNSIVLHGTVTHDMNPVSRTEANKVIEKCKKMLKIPVENKNFYLIKESKGNAKVLLLGFDGSKNEGLFILSRAPKTTEDISLGLGMAIRNNALNKFNEAIIVDAHNAETGEFTTFNAGSKIGFEYLDAVDKVKPIIKTKKCYFGFSKMEINEASVGGAGVRVAILGNSKEKFALIVFDSNGVEPEMRERIISAIKEKYGIDSEILTTDQHSNNVVEGVRNPLSQDIAIKTSLICVENALNNLEEVKVGFSVERMTLKVFGPKNSITVIGTVNSIVAILKILAPFILLAAFALALYGVVIH